mmetsp:Transcript_5483/g.11939  ORF Transcript_5483/g.11939 Transcript_5483/m.11939 type:complete len:556 (+) Transcript_5483:40-1707(+)|eukprot:CAMPEP_0172529988 /NCGR_PEP_ID=MMETSP1067-20121228/3887_1 /TAXON_ID=265564 ORGANISM="Thalassiosira punctigera, Strain Tpunct2005C2" /NCGR_SAMPLE_ID=MMETSP1067 /ASSEMBLY_ACC=CAM_ASM_000444 /LENGTH=555 /DNA_ID=CAMNT_0013314129 /DNA_START=15 /DNA_END=1682 /DNA_ORIENTATION=-
MIYPIAEHSPSSIPSSKISRRHRWRISFAGVVVPGVLIAVATLSLAGVLVGMRHVTLLPSSQPSKSVRDSMLMPVNSRSNDQKQSDDGVSPEGDRLYADSYSNHRKITVDVSVSNEPDSLPVDSGSNDSDDKMSDEVDALTTHSDSNDEQLSEDKSDESDERQFVNEKKVEADRVPSNSLRHRETHFPRIISIGGRSGNANNHLRGEPDDEKRSIYVSSRERKEQERLLESDDFSYRDPLYEGDCVPMQKWQETSFPNCNLFHELDFLEKSRTQQFEFYAKGGYNHIFWLEEVDKKDDPELVMKILKYGTEYSDRNFDRVRRDGLILERLTHSPYVLDVYGFCGFDVLTPYADGGTFSHEINSWAKGRLKLSPKTRLKYAVEIASGLADVHDIDREGLSSVAHGDLKGGQYLFLDGVIKLGDFNRGRFLRRNSTAPNTACPYTIGKNDAAFRSPEEYEYLPQTSAIDVWALGSIMYEILTGKDVWYNTDTKKAQRYIRKGKLPTIDDKYLESQDPVDVALREAIGMCYVFDPHKRAKAADVASYLRKKLLELPEE